MARFRSTGCVIIGAVKYRAGQVFVDTVGNALAGDVVYPGGLDTGKMSPNLVPLDATAIIMLANSRFAGVVPWPIDGAHSEHG